jgi:hypothetical protein
MVVSSTYESQRGFKREERTETYLGVLRILCLVKFAISSPLLEPEQVHAMTEKKRSEELRGT